MSTVEFEASGKTDQEDSGFAASYTMGSMSFSASSNKSDNAGGTSGIQALRWKLVTTRIFLNENIKS